MKIEIKNRWNNEVLFTHEVENNTIKITLLEAIKRNANLRNANLWNADLRNANLRNANLWNANLWNADLRNADLWNADLWNADLRNADLRNANLNDADLRNADLRNANGNCREIKTVQTDIWHVCMTANVMQIGCKQHTLEQWDNFSDDEISDMDKKALGFWKNWKKLLFKIHKKSFKETQ